MSGLVYALTLAAALGSGLASGVFFAFSTFVMSGLARLPAPAGVAAMNSINVTAVSPAFMTLLFGTAALCLATAGVAIWNWAMPGSALLLAASLLYLAGIIAVTIVFNVPLNNALAATAPDSAAAAEAWKNYLSVWVGWNHVRTLAGLGSAALFVLALR